MISRYSSPEISKIWSDRHKFDLWLKIELLVCEAWAKEGKIPKEVSKHIQEKVTFDLKEIEEFEKTLKHDVLAFLASMKKSVLSEAAKYIHFGLTSSDIVDTAFSLQLVESRKLILKALELLCETLWDLHKTHVDTQTMGRTHGQFAENTTFGYKMKVFYEEMCRNHTRIETTDIDIGKISGAVGNHANVPESVENYVLNRLELSPSVCTQVVPRDIHAEFFISLAILGGSLERLATEIRHLQRSEVGEVAEGFSEGQRGSSAMPHKKNPIGSENICGLARILRANAMAALENIALWHERDISHSSVERIIAPDSCELAYYMVNRMNDIMKNLVVNKEKMAENIKLAKNQHLSGKILLKLVEHGMDRDKAYDIVQRSAFRAKTHNSDLIDELHMDFDFVASNIDWEKL